MTTRSGTPRASSYRDPVERLGCPASGDAFANPAAHVR